MDNEEHTEPGTTQPPVASAPPSAKHVRFVWLIIGVAIVVALVVESLVDYSLRPTPAPREAVEVSAVELTSAYEANEIAADRQYANVPLKIDGLLGEIGRTFDGVPYLSIGRVQALFPMTTDDTPLAALQKGRYVVVRCEGGSRRVLTLVIARDCVLVR